MKTPYKYVVLLPVSEPESSFIKSLMDQVAACTQIPPPYTELVPHITLHRPITGVNEELYRHKTAGGSWEQVQM